MLWSRPVTQGSEAVDTEHCGVLGFCRQSVQTLFHVGRRKGQQRVPCLSNNHFRQDRAGGNGCRTSADPVPRFNDAFAIEQGRQFEDIAARRIADFDSDRGRRKLAYIAGIAKMI